VAIMGGSYGGYAVLCAMAFAPMEFCCGIDLGGFSSLLTVLKFARQSRFHRYSVPYYEMTFGVLSKDDTLMKSFSPLYFADKITAPLLIIHGRDDKIVPVSESAQMFSALNGKNGLDELVIVENTGHDWEQISMEQAENFLAENLGGRLESCPIQNK
jgi:dipeptidyl aminopeptidase/acylaminoacyl peptidase